MDISNLEGKLGITFNNRKLLKQAFIHSSYVNEHLSKNHHDNERLEFLGDAALELGVSQYLYKKYPDLPEGELTKIRASIVCEESLVEMTRMLKLNEYMLLGKGEEKSGGRERPSLLADLFEAFLGALYLDQGYSAMLLFLEEYIFPKIEKDAFSHVMDYKSQLQELVQQKENFSIQYKITQEKGPSHAKQFSAQVQINGQIYQGSFGKSKKEAEQRAAKKALDAVKKLYF